MIKAFPGQFYLHFGSLTLPVNFSSFFRHYMQCHPFSPAGLNLKASSKVVIGTLGVLKMRNRDELIMGMLRYIVLTLSMMCKNNQQTTFSINFVLSFL